ncbi:MAG: hypothetical protein WBI63_02530 [Coriobacteriia bacterium]
MQDWLLDELGVANFILLVFGGYVACATVALAVQLRKRLRPIRLAAVYAVLGSAPALVIGWVLGLPAMTVIVIATGVAGGNVLLSWSLERRLERAENRGLR